MALTPAAADAAAAQGRYQRVHAQTPPCGPAQYIFARRKPKDRSAKPRYYLYSADGEDLIASAKSRKAKGRLAFKVSTNALDIKKKSPFFVGLCAESESRRTFFGYKAFPGLPAAFHGTVRICCDRGSECVVLPPAGDPDYAFPELPGAEFPAGVQSLSVARAADGDRESVTIARRDEVAMIVRQTGEDEFAVDCRAPFTPFQAFCAACVLTTR
jgi:hypothetical protein